MDVSAQLEKALESAREDAGFPDALAREIAEICDNRVLHDGHERQLRALADALERFDPYAGAGCFGDAASVSEIEALVKGFRK